MPLNDYYIEVAPAAPVLHTYTYRVNPQEHGQINVGQRVLVPFGKRRLTAYVVQTNVDIDNLEVTIKPVEYALDAKPCFPEAMLDLFRWVAGYYKYPLGLVLETALPQGINVAESLLYQVADTNSAAYENLTPQTRELLTLLAKKPRTLKSLQRATGLKTKDLQRELNQLAAQNVVEQGLALTGQTIKAKTEKWVRLNADAEYPPQRMTAARLKVLELLQYHPEMALSQLLDAAQATAGVVTKLAELGVVELYEERVYRDPLGMAIEQDEPKNLNRAQAEALQAILDSIHYSQKAQKPILLQGVTGSGKTELYLQAAQATLNLGRTVLILVPEIALITQTEHRFKARFGENVAILHSALSPGERYDQWTKILNGDVKVVVGVRSAIFAPLDNLGLIVVDEEHDGSYKQETGLKYHARDVAIVRAQKAGCPVILGSATPSLQTAHNAKAGKYTYLALPGRINAQKLPDIAVVDLRKEQANKMITPALQKAISETLLRGEQVLLFLNRRGFTPSLLCKDCGETLSCPHCDISLTYHKNKNAAICHFCGYMQPSDRACEKCASANIIPLGVGIQRVEEHVAAMFPEARIARLDRDTAQDRKTMLAIFRNLKQGHIDILLGTQMVAKGHDFPNITLVGVICADMSLNLPDFRADETTFQLLTQVAGRSGRGTKAGQVILQTYNPNHHVIKAACAQDYEAFYRHESETRRLLHYPPFSRVAQVRVNAKSARLTKETAQALGAFCQNLKHGNKTYALLEILGPVEAPIAKISNWHRWHLLLKCPHSKTLHAFVENLLANAVKGLESEDVKISVDIDPVSMM